MAFIVDPYLLGVTLTMVVVLVIYNVYMIAHYSHYADKALGTSTAAKGLITVAFMCAQGQVLMLPLDASNYFEQTDIDMRAFWFIVFMSSLVLLSVALPFMLTFYESDETEDFKRRFCGAMKYTTIWVVILSFIIFPTYVTNRYSDIPVVADTCLGYINDSVYTDITVSPNMDVFMDANSDANTISDRCVKSDQTIEITLSFAIYTIGLMCIAGWLPLLFFLGAGLSAMPLDYINAFRDRPTPMNQTEFEEHKSILTSDIDQLVKVGRDLLERKLKADKISGMRGWINRRNLRKEQSKYETNCIIAEKKFYVLDQVSNYNRVVEPLVYNLYLLLGIFFLLLSFLIVFHIFVSTLLTVQGKPITPFLNTFFEDIFYTEFSFVSMVLFAALGYYILLSVIKGNVKFGLRFFFITFYPLVPKETFISSFVANAFMMNLYMVALTQCLCKIFSTFLVGTEAAKIFEVQVMYQRYIGKVLQSNYLIGITMFWWFLSSIYFLLKPRERIDIGESLKKKDITGAN